MQIIKKTFDMLCMYLIISQVLSGVILIAAIRHTYIRDPGAPAAIDDARRASNNMTKCT